MSVQQREANRGVLSDSSGLVAPLKREKNPPSYGAQHRQDALWEGELVYCGIDQLIQYQAGGNEALPPMWKERKAVGIAEPLYSDDTLFINTYQRPLPGMRLGERQKCDESEELTVKRRLLWVAHSWMRMAHLTTRSVLLH
jgi:hypothetical protein